MKFCWFLRSVMFAVRSLGRFLGRGVCLVTAESGQSPFFEKLSHLLLLKSESSLQRCLSLRN